MAKLKRRKRKLDLAKQQAEKDVESTLKENEIIGDLLKHNEDGIRCGYCSHFRNARARKSDKVFFRICDFYKPSGEGRLRLRKKSKEVTADTVACCGNFVAHKYFWCDLSGHWQHLVVCLYRHQTKSTSPINCANCRQFDTEISFLLDKIDAAHKDFQPVLKLRKNKTGAFFEDESIIVEMKPKPIEEKTNKLKRRISKKNFFKKRIKNGGKNNVKKIGSTWKTFRKRARKND